MRREDSWGRKGSIPGSRGGCGDWRLATSLNIGNKNGVVGVILV